MKRICVDEMGWNVSSHSRHKWFALRCASLEIIIVLDFADLLGGMTILEFEKNYRGKAFVVFPRTEARTELFDNIIDWQEFSRYINNDRATAGMQAITP